MSGALNRARSLMARSGGWIDPLGPEGPYAVRLGPDRRARVAITIDEAAFRALIAEPGLKARPGGGWIARTSRPDTLSTAGRPGRIEGERALIEADGRLVVRRANLGESPIAWLARRKDGDGRPFLSPAEAAAGERLRRDAERAESGPSLTMRWDALPRSGGGSVARTEPGDRALNAARRVAEALDACPATTRAFVEQICIRQTALQAAEQEAGVRRRQGRIILKQGLQALARHYRLG